MENWQKIHITKNLPSLLSLTDCNVLLLSILKAEDVLSETDFEEINAKATKHNRSSLLYDILLTRLSGYGKLMKALADTNQTGALDILLFQIPTDIFGNLTVSFCDTKNSLHNIFDENQIRNIQKWIREHISSKECFTYFDSAFKPNAVMHLLRDTIPKLDPLYVSRFLSRRLSVNKKFFRVVCDDVLVFKEAQRNQIREWAHNFAIESSTTQLFQSKLTARFIILESEDDWKKICCKTSNPVHLLRYEEEEKRFVLEATTGGSKTIGQYLEHKRPLNEIMIPEDEFLKKVLSDSCKGVSICDLPGMGKSLLLASLAHKVQKLYSEKIVAFIELQRLGLKESTYQQQSELFKSGYFQHIATSKLASRILFEVICTRKIECELFFDGLDELQGDQLKLTTVFLQNIIKLIPKVKVYVTSRPVLRHELEKALQVIAYDIHPFDSETQCQFLCSYWTKQNASADNKKLKKFATLCFEHITSFLKENEKNITGIPLLCRLIAETYVDQASVYADCNRNSVYDLSDHFPNSLSEMYDRYVHRQLGKPLCKYICMHRMDQTNCNVHCKVRSFHVWQALQLIFPSFANHILQHASSFDELNFYNVLSPGILVKKSQIEDSRLEFVHRTFAEYLVAEYFAEIIFSDHLHNKQLQDYQTFAQQLAFDMCFEYWGPRYMSYRHFYHIVLRQNVVAYFLNAKLASNQCLKVICTANSSTDPRWLVYPIVACLCHDYEYLLNIYVQATKNVESEFRVLANKSIGETQRDFTWDLLRFAANHGSLKSIEKLVTLLTNYFTFELNTNISRIEEHPLTIALYRADYEVVKFLLEKFSYCPSNFLYQYFCLTYQLANDEASKRLDIYKLLLRKYGDTKADLLPSKELISKLINSSVDLNIVKFLIEQCTEDWKPCDKLIFSFVKSAINYMLAEDFLEFCYILVSKCNAWGLFFEADEWKKIFSESWVSMNRPSLMLLVSILRLINTKNTQQYCMQKTSFEEAFIPIKTEDKLLEELKPLLNTEIFSEFKAVFHHIYFTSIEQGNIEVVDLFLSFSMALVELKNKDKLTPLLLASANGRKDMFKYLVFKGADIFALDSYNCTILHTCVSSRDNDFFHWMVKLLRDKEKFTFWNVLAAIVSIPLRFRSINNSNLNETKPKSVSELLGWQNKYNQTPLHYAIEYLDLSAETLELFVEKNKFLFWTKQTNVERLNAVDQGGTSLLHHAILKNQNVAMHLVQCGADFSSRDKHGCNVVHACACRGFVELLEYFISIGVDITELDCRGNDALQCILYTNYLKDKNKLRDIVGLLISAGVNTKRKNWIGLTAYDMAAKQNIASEILELL